MREISSADLALADGVRSERIWIAYKGVVYDVSKSKLFAHGKHYNHPCGCDLTHAMSKAPHFEDLVFRFEVVGKLMQ